ncbi:MAG: hypothetical protein M1822_002187 [Bathelium mastoideum]|nr:MAG: hypothetical protein M1822_002187 [Bathelium mastoideum]
MSSEPDWTSLPASFPPRLAPSSQPTKPQRVLACVLCQQRKVRCDRNFPCSNCTKSNAPCVPAASTPRQRRRRFTERELLERLRKYEDLLRQNGIKFDPLHKDATGGERPPHVDGRESSADEPPEAVGAGRPSHLTTAKSEGGFEVKNFWRAMSQAYRDHDNDSDFSDDELKYNTFKKAWDQSCENNNHLLFGLHKTTVDLSTAHPDPVHLFRLWQIYLDNVNPLLKVTHTSSLQSRIIEAVSNLTNVDSNLEALMFSIYCMSVRSIDPQDCQSIFGSSKESLLKRYQFGCQQALLNFEVSVRPSVDPQSLSSMLSVAIRIAQRMGLHSESACAKCNPLEAEMRRRLWWSLVLFDNRIGEMAQHKTASLSPAWDCRIPRNLDDSDLRPEMKDLPAAQEKPTEALFAVARSDIGDFTRSTMYHLDFTNPTLKSLVKDARRSALPAGGEVVVLEKVIEEKYLKFCDPEVPLHFMTIWTTRAYLAKCRLEEYWSTFPDWSVSQTEAQRDAAISYALSRLECDTKITSSPLTKGFSWLTHCYFPFPSYLFISQDLRRRPASKQAERAWEVMSDNYRAHFDFTDGMLSPFFKIFAKLVLQAWEARQAISGQSGEHLAPPRIVSFIRQKIAQSALDTDKATTEQHGTLVDSSIGNLLMPLSTDFVTGSFLYDMGGYGGCSGLLYPDMSDDAHQLDWSTMDWGQVDAPPAETFEPAGPLSLNPASKPTTTRGSWTYQ